MSPPSPSSSTEAPCRSARTASPEAPVTPSPPPPKGRHAFAAFKNNVLNINPTAYMWVKNSSGYSRLCHKCSPSSEPVQAHLWIVGSLERHTLDSATKSFNAWTVTLRLSQECNRSLDALLNTGPLKSYDPPNRYSVLKVKASFDSVQEGDDDEEFLSTTSPFPFMYDGSCLVEGRSRVPEPCDVSMFSAQSLVAVEVSVLGYPRMGDRDPSYSFGIRGIYHLGFVPTSAPSTPGKRKGGCVISPRQQKGARFVSDPSCVT
jgi:hypothetical protein